MSILPMQNAGRGSEARASVSAKPQKCECNYGPKQVLRRPERRGDTPIHLPVTPPAAAVGAHMLWGRPTETADVLLTWTDDTLPSTDVLEDEHE